MSLRSRRAATPGVELGLDDDAAADDVQPAREPQHRRHLGLAAAGLGDRRARASSSLTAAVIAMGSDPATHRESLAVRTRSAGEASGPDRSRTSPGSLGITRPAVAIVPRRAVAPGDVGATSRHRAAAAVGERGPVDDGRGRRRARRRARGPGRAGEHLEVALRREAVGLPGLRREVERQQPAGRWSRAARRAARAPAGAASRW